MNQQRVVTARRLAPPVDVYVLAGVLISLFLVGTFADFAISRALFNPTSGFGVFLAAYGESPAFIVWAASGSLLISGRNRTSTLWKYLQILVGAGLIIGAFAAMAIWPLKNIDWPFWILILISLVAIGITVYISFRVSAGVDRKVVLTVAAVLFAVVFLELVIITALKILWERPRMRMLTTTPEAYFQPWWSPGYADKETLMAGGVASEEFKSFPSGHSSNGACAMLLTTLAAFRERLAERVSQLFWVGATWALLVALSRIIMGAHFLTDTVAGLAVTFVAMILCYRYAFPNRRGRRAAT